MGKEDIIAAIIGITVIISLIIYVPKFFQYLADSSKEYRQEQVRQIDECIKKTDDFDWCMEKFYK